MCLYAREHVLCLLSRGKLDRARNSGQQKTWLFNIQNKIRHWKISSYVSERCEKVSKRNFVSKWENVVISLGIEINKAVLAWYFFSVVKMIIFNKYDYVRYKWVKIIIIKAIHISSFLMIIKIKFSIVSFKTLTMAFIYVCIIVWARRWPGHDQSFLKDCPNRKFLVYGENAVRWRQPELILLMFMSYADSDQQNFLVFLRGVFPIRECRNTNVIAYISVKVAEVI